MKKRAPRNRTITLDDEERERLKRHLKGVPEVHSDMVDSTILGNCLEIASYIASESVDMLFLDPPYNINKQFGNYLFTKKPVEKYTEWLYKILDTFLPKMKSTGTVYICGDWHTSTSIFTAASNNLKVRNRITWEREKGRGAKSNWKNSSEDIWFCTISNIYIQC